MYRPRRSEIYNSVITRMVREGLDEKEANFRAEHGNDTDEELLDYFRSKTLELGHTPWPKEIVGWQVIEERFGNWQDLPRLAGVPKMRTPNKPTKFQLYLDEIEVQKEKYRQNRIEKKEKSLERQKQQKERRERQKLYTGEPDVK